MGLTLMTMKVSDYVCVQLITQDECSRFALAYHTSGGFAIVVQAKNAFWQISIIGSSVGLKVSGTTNAASKEAHVWNLDVEGHVSFNETWLF